MKLPLYQVDAFTDRCFTGNPAAVCPLKSWLSDDILQNLALENNLSETAFFVPTPDGFAIRWFTPVVEVDLCGHATLASAHVIFNHLKYAKSKIYFSTVQRGDLSVTQKGERIALNFPTTKPRPIEIFPKLVTALGKPPLEVFQSRDLLALYATEEDILDVQPDFTLLKALDCLGVIISAPGKHSDFVSRFFAPQAGINEDPVTGSAHTTLIPFWSERLNKKDLHAFQISSRGGELFCKNLGDRVEIGGKAVTYLVGEIEI